MRAINIAFVFISILSICLLSYTVVISLNNPIHMENMFLNDYKSVDRNYNKISRHEAIFNQDVEFDYKFVSVDNKYQLSISLKSDKYSGFMVTSFLTRKHTNQYDTNLDMADKVNNSYIFNLPSLSKGAWKVIVKIQVKDITVYKNIDFVSPIKVSVF